MKTLGLLLLLATLSTGCLPIAVNRTKGEPSVCPVHQVAMKRERVDLVGIMAKIDRDESCPYAGYPEYGGCMVPQPLWARVYVCSECKRDYRAAYGHDASKH